MAGHVWQEYGSETLRAQPPDPNVREPGDGGRGHYRNISLLNLWAHAPFLHNNALGPELCGKPHNAANDFYAQRPRYVDASNVKLLPAERQPACFEYDPSVDGRFKLYTLSMQALLNPAQRIPKVTLLNEDVTLRVGPRLWDSTDKEKLLGFELTIPSEFSTISRVRSATDTSMMFMIPMPPTSREIAAMPPSISESVFITSSMVSSNSLIL